MKFADKLFLAMQKEEKENLKVVFHPDDYSSLLAHSRADGLLENEFPSITVRVMLKNDDTVVANINVKNPQHYVDRQTTISVKSYLVSVVKLFCEVAERLQEAVNKDE